MADLRAPQRSVLDVREQRSAANPPFMAIADRDLGQVLRITRTKKPSQQICWEGFLLFRIS